MAYGNNSIGNTCGDHHFASCTFYESPLPLFTTLLTKNCYSLEEIIADIYQIESNIIGEIDLSALLTNGIVYTLSNGKIEVKEALRRHSELLISLQTAINDLSIGNDKLFSITGWGLNFECIADNCANPPDTLKELIQLMITEVCSLKSRVTALETP